jgi:short-subunit dehydrogenase
MTTNNNALSFYGDQTSIEGRAVIVTGGTEGIGRAIAILLAMQGAKVIIAGQDQGHLDETLQLARDEHMKGTLEGIIADLSTEAGISSLFKEADKKLGGVEVLVNNAAQSYQSVTEGSYGDIEFIVRTNLLGYLACAKEAIKRMQPRKQGYIVNIGSMSADVREKDSSVYVATKSGIQGFSESLRKEVNELGIKVTLVEPGAVGTDMQPVSKDAEKEKQENLEMLKAEDIARAVLYALTQPARCDVVDIKIRPHLQLI